MSCNGQVCGFSHIGAGGCLQSTISLPCTGNIGVTSQLTNGNVISLISSFDMKRINAAEAREELK